MKPPRSKPGTKYFTGRIPLARNTHARLGPWRKIDLDERGSARFSRESERVVAVKLSNHPPSSPRGRGETSWIIASEEKSTAAKLSSARSLGWFFKFTEIVAEERVYGSRSVDLLPGHSRSDQRMRPFRALSPREQADGVAPRASRLR